MSILQKFTRRSVSVRARYVPPHKILSSAMQIDEKRSGESYVALPAALFWELFQAAVAGCFDQDSYVAQYPDVAEALASGKFGSALQHYVANGYKEDRTGIAYAVDESWYLDQYPDVRQAITLGTFKSAADHFRAAGYLEGRCPSQEMKTSVAMWTGGPRT